MNRDRIPSTCLEKLRLLNEYNKLATAYSRKVSELNEKIGTSTKGEYDAMYRVTEALRQSVDHAKKALESHIEAHGC